MGSLGKEKHGVYRRKDDPDAPWNQPRKPRGQGKDRKRWCRGKPGREHTPMLKHWAGPCEAAPPWMARLGRSWWCHHIEVCEACGKKLRWLKDHECPDAP